MANQRTIPPTDSQGHYVIPATAEYLDPAFQPNMPTHQQTEYSTTQNCFCLQCSAMRRTQGNPPTLYPVEQRDPRHFGNSDRNVDDHAETAMILPNHARTQPAPPQTTAIPENFGYAPVYERAGPPNGESSRAPIHNTSIAEGRRRLAGRYLNNPEAYVSMIRLEPGASGQFQVVITLEMVNLL